MNILAGARRALLTLAIMGGLALPAAAQGFNLNYDTIAASLREAGFKAELQTDDDGLQWIKGYSDAVKASFEARLDSCDEDGDYCAVLVLSAGFNFGPGGKALAAEKINDWNVNHFGKAYILDDTMWISSETSTDGVTKANLDATVDWFGMLVPDYVGFIGWKPN